MLMHMNQLHFARSVFSGLVALATCVALIAAPLAGAQAPAASGNAAQATSPDQLETLVGPIALYPDDLVAIILPASTNPLQLVQAERFLEKRKTDSKLPINDKWDESVKSLVNYPEVVKLMSDDLDWTTDLGEAVVANQGAVLDAVQGFRRRVQAAGHLKTDSKQVVVVENEVVKIVPADPQVIYVPQYTPATVAAYSSVPAYGYYPSAYPVYYYPYAPGAALATGLIWGAAIGAAWNGGRYGTNWSGGNNNITINRNVSTGNINRAQTQRAQATTWKSDKRPGQVSSGSTRTTSARFNNARPGDAAGGARASTQRTGDTAGGARASTKRAGDATGGARASTQRSGGQQGTATRSQVSGAQSRDALGGYGSGRAAGADSSRGAASRSSMSSHAALSSPGAHAGGRRGGRGR